MAIPATMHGTLFSGALLISIIVIRSVQALLLEACAVDHKYPFVFQTLLLFPFFMQTCSLFCAVAAEVGFSRGISIIVSSAKYTGPVLLYATLLALNVVLQGWSLLYINSSTYVVVLQLLVVFVALAERLLLDKPMSSTIWLLVFVQSGSVMAYQLTVSDAKEVSLHARSPTLHGLHPYHGNLDANSGWFYQAVGVGLVVVALMCNSVGSIAQQRFLQTPASASGGIGPLAWFVPEAHMPLSVKLFYQFLFGFLDIVLYTLSSREAVVSIATNGFFFGWTSTTFAVGMCMWGAYLISTLICAYVSALAGAMAIAMVVIAIGAFDAVVRGWPTTALQVFLMFLVSTNSAYFAHLRSKAQAPHKPMDDLALEDAEEPTARVFTLKGMGRSFGTLTGGPTQKKSMETSSTSA